ncbi:lipoprotein [Streptomyces thermocarboxydovorans]|uniref:Lipoprotein n=1 Tax=Streptomyces thermocarboxydovorans TaxID=59298 RepID=A0ABN1HHL9_9ACTN
MHAIRVASAALAGAGALTFASAPVAGAETAAGAPPAAVSYVGRAPALDGGITPFGFEVKPNIVEPGDTVGLRVERDDGGCRGPARVSSAVFDTVTIPPQRSTAMAVVDRDARVGAEYRVEFTCDGATGSTVLTVVGGTPVPLPSPIDEEPGRHSEGYHGRHPRGVHAGEGGTLAGIDLGRVGLGAVFVTGALGVAYRLSRRGRTEDGG